MSAQLRQVLICVCVSLITTVAFNVAKIVIIDRNTDWQYDGVRRVQIERKKQEEAQAKARADMITHPEKYALRYTNAVGLVMTNYAVNFFTINNGYWGDYYVIPSGSDAIELGYRRDGAVTWRTPPEAAVSVFDKAVKQAKAKAVQIQTNLF